MFKAEILADSLNPQGNRITTMKITFPRIVLAEFNTHRMFSRNSASSRAIPFKKMVQMVEENPFIPIAWQKDHKGMQGTEYFTDNENIKGCEEVWLSGRDKAIEEAKELNKDFGEGGVTKQLCNRLLEPFMWHTVIVTATEWENFFNLRCPQYEVSNGLDVNIYRSRKDAIKIGKASEKTTNLEWLRGNKSQAEIHIQAIAELMWDVYNESTPKQLQAGEWHIPFGDNFDEKLLDMKHWVGDNTVNKVKIATARCARISYETLGDNPKIDYEADIKLHDALKNMEHWSPFEHIAKAMNEDEYNQYTHSIYEYDLEEQYYVGAKVYKGWCRNFKGFIQYRSLIDN